jgi:hypothetical protein
MSENRKGEKRNIWNREAVTEEWRKHVIRGIIICIPQQILYYLDEQIKKDVMGRTSVCLGR